MPKFLVAGDARGDLATLFARAAKLQASKHGPFDALLCVGRFLDEQGAALQMGRLAQGADAPPLPTYLCTAGEAPQLFKHVADGGELAPGLHYLGRQGVAAVAGARVAFLAAGAGPVPAAAADVLLCAEWPAGVERGLPDAQLPAALPPRPSAAAAAAALATAPRYVFAGGAGVHWARPPYANEPGGAATWFYGLGAVGGAEKWMHAVNVDLGAARPRGATPCPFEASSGAGAGASGAAKRGRPDWDRIEAEEAARRRPAGGMPAAAGGGAPPPTYQCPVCHMPGHWEDKCPTTVSKRQRAAVTPDSCWFCLANPSVETHLIAAIGEHSYVALPKGGINAMHALVVPIEHVTAVAELAPAARACVEARKADLVRMHAAAGRGTLVWDRAVRTRAAAHMQLQVVPVEAAALPALVDKLREAAAPEGVVFDDLPAGADPPAGQYLLFELYGPSAGAPVSRVAHAIHGRHNLSLARELAAAALGVPDRADWKACAGSRDDEERDVEAFKGAFGGYSGV